MNKHITLTLGIGGEEPFASESISSAADATWGDFVQQVATRLLALGKELEDASRYSAEGARIVDNRTASTLSPREIAAKLSDYHRRLYPGDTLSPTPEGPVTP